jgi:hypothetical protein
VATTSEATPLEMRVSAYITSRCRRQSSTPITA